MLNNNLEIVDLGLFIKDKKTLVLCDFHIGYEESLNRKGVLLPRFQFNDTLSRLTKIVLRTNPDKIIINGDLKHEFGTISSQEWRETLCLLAFMMKSSREVILIKGNHDKILGPIAKKKDVRVKMSYVSGDILITHGDKLPVGTKGIKTIIIGHEHPCISVTEHGRTEKFKCFLKGKWKNKDLIVQPSFNLVTEGTDVISEQLLSPFLKQKLGGFEAFVIADKMYSFGKLANLLV